MESDLSKSSLSKYLHEEITPVVMLLCTPLAEQACRKNSLTLVQMLKPFSVTNIQVPVRTTTDHLPYTLRSFKLRFVSDSDIRQPQQQDIVCSLKEVVSCASDETTYDPQSDPPQLHNLLYMSESEVSPPWFSAFNRNLSQAVSFSEHETFDHPVACLVIVSSSDEHPMSKFGDLLSLDQLPTPLNQGVMDPRMLKHYILLHDKQEDSTEKASKIYAEMKNTLGLNQSRMLCINSNQDEALKLVENPWKTGTVQDHEIARFLSIEDLNEIKEFVKDLSSKMIIPYMEQKIRNLNQQVSATRRGFRNQIKNLWWRKGKEDASDNSNGSMYTYSSTESQIRILGDYAFMLRDYDLAISNFRLLSTDYKLDKAWKHYAGVQEMMGLSLFMLDQSRKDSELCMETAFNAYLKLGSSGSKNATRCGIWWAEMLKARGQHKEGAAVLFRISREEHSLHAAVMLEQASYCYLLSNPPMLRKFAFHLVLAGNQYHISEQRKHAIRTYRSALSVYKGSGWSYINDHVNFNIGSWFAFLEMFDAAVKNMLGILECSHQPLTTQNLFLKDFFQIVKNMGKKLEVSKLQLPSISASSLKVIFEDQRTYASSSAVRVREKIWQSLEENMVPPVNGIKSNWLDSRKLQTPKKYSGNVSMVGEAIKVYFEVKNPLQISLSVSGMSLLCEISAKPTAESGEKNSNTGEIFDTRDQNDYISAHNQLELSEHNFVLEGGVIKGVQLDVTPKMEGFLKIVGVKWTLSGYVVGYHKFDVDLKKKYKKRKSVGRSQKHNMSFLVVKGLPKLEGYIHQVPKSTYSGDLRPLTFELRNKTKYIVKNMKMKISHPRLLIPGSSGDLGLEFPDCLKKQTSSEGRNIQAEIMHKSGGLLFSFPTNAKINGGDNFQWPFWLHTAVSGKISICISIYYEMENISCDLHYRTLRMLYEMEVSPSLDVSMFITPCTSKMQEFLVRMEINSRTMSKGLWLRQLSSVGSRWEISLLPAHTSVCSSQLLLAGQSLMCFFKLKDRGEISSENNSQIVKGNDVRLGSLQDNQFVFDVSRTPLIDFHYYERLHQEKYFEEVLSTVDFILLSHLVEDDIDPEKKENCQLLSHHACHHSVIGKSPVWWLMNGPQTISHDFSTSFCEATFYITLHNSSDVVASVKIVTIDAMTPDSEGGQTQDTSPHSDSSTRVGWHNVSLENDVKVEKKIQKQRVLESVCPFIWSATSSTHIKLEPMNIIKVPLRICIFSPGVYDLSKYELRWSLQSSDPPTRFLKDPPATWQSSGVNRGHPFFLTVMQSHDNLKVY